MLDTVFFGLAALVSWQARGKPTQVRLSSLQHAVLAMFHVCLSVSLLSTKFSSRVRQQEQAGTCMQRCKAFLTAHWPRSWGGLAWGAALGQDCSTMHVL